MPKRGDKIRYLTCSNGCWYWNPPPELRSNPDWARVAYAKPVTWRGSVKILTELSDIRAHALERTAALDAWRKGAAENAPKPTKVSALRRKFLKQFQEKVTAGERSRATYSQYEIATRRLVLWLEEAGDPPLSRITRDDVQTYAKALETKAGPSVTRFTVSAWAVFFGWAQLNNHYPPGLPNPARKLALKTQQRRLSIWSQEELDCFIRTAQAMGHDDVAIAVMIAAYTGARLADVASLRADMIEQREAAVMLDGRQTRQARNVIVFTPQKTKNSSGEIAYAPIHKALAAVLPADGFLATRADRALNLAARITRQFNAVRAKASKSTPSLKDRTFHDLRRTFITRLEEAGASDAQIAAITGHSTGGRGSINRYSAAQSVKAMTASALLERMDD